MAKGSEELVHGKPVESPARNAPATVVPAENPAQPPPSGVKAVNLPDPKRPFVDHYRKAVLKQTAIKRGVSGGDDDVEEIRLNAICPVKGCGYPLVNRLEEPPGADGLQRFQIKPTNWDGPFVRVCLFDPAHFREEYLP